MQNKSPSFDKLRAFADSQGFLVARSDCDNMRTAIISPFEFLNGIAWPWNVFPNRSQAFQALKKESIALNTETQT